MDNNKDIPSIGSVVCSAFLVGCFFMGIALTLKMSHVGDVNNTIALFIASIGFGFFGRITYIDTKKLIETYEKDNTSNKMKPSHAGELFYRRFIETERLSKKDVMDYTGVTEDYLNSFLYDEMDAGPLFIELISELTNTSTDLWDNLQRNFNYWKDNNVGNKS